MKAKNKSIYDARVALAKIANADVPLPVVLTAAPLLDACDPVIAECRRLEEAADRDKDEEKEARAAYLTAETELPDVILPALPEFRMSYLEFRALREIAGIGEV